MTYTPPPDTTPLAQVYEEIRKLAAAEVSTMQAQTNVPIPSGTSGYSLPITFTEPFDVVPAVVATSGSASLTNPRIFDKTANGFTIRWDRSSSGSYTFDWIATTPS